MGSILRTRFDDLRRARRIVRTFGKELLHIERPPPLRVRLACEKLGVTFIKAAQILSSTYGIVPAPYVAEFRRCLDRVPAMPMSTVRNVIERSYGRPLGRVFSSFDPRPLASASVAQVHRARLTTGEEVVAKVKRPDLMMTVQRDLNIGYVLARAAQRGSRWAAAVNFVGIVEEFERTINEELDLVHEAEFMARYRELVAEVDDDHVFVPRVYTELSTEDVLILEEVHGVPLTQHDRIRGRFDAHELLARLMRTWFEVMIRHGVFHGDLHAGNVLFVEPNRVALVDFGVTGTLDENRRRALLDLLVFTILDDDRLVARHFKKMGFVPDSVDDEMLRRRIREVIDKCVGVPLEDQRFEDLFTGMVEMSLEFGGAVPREIMLMTRQQIYLASHARALAPGKDIVRHPAMLDLLFPRPKLQYIPAPVDHPRYRLPMPDDEPSARAIPCPICTTVIESDIDFEHTAQLYCYACFSELEVVADGSGPPGAVAR